ncbi:unnamed protein product [Boreogadus saida]
MECTPALNNPIRSNNSLSRIILSSLTRNNPTHSTPTLNNPIRSNNTLSHIILSDPTSKNTPLIKPTHSHLALQIPRTILQ